MQPLLPVIADNGYQATFSFVRTDELARRAENALTDRLFIEAKDALSQGYAGDKQAAQDAYDKLQEILDRHGDGAEDIIALRKIARDLGTTKVLLETDNRVSQQIPGYVSDILEESTAVVTSTFWTQYYQNMPDTQQADYIVRLVFNAVQVQPEQIRQEEIHRRKKIQDGWEYVLDARGNVLKDSLGNDVKTPAMWKSVLLY